MKIKKLNTLFLLAALLTTGGVYASWNYATSGVNSAQTEAKVQIDLGSSSSKGTLDIVSADTSIQATVVNVQEGGVYTYKTDVVFTGQIKIKFTPAAYADQDVKDSGIKLKLTITENFANYTYGGGNVDVFRLEGGGDATSYSYILNDGNPILGEYIILGEKTADVDDNGTTNVRENLGLGSYVNMEPITLDTRAKFDSLKSIIDAGTFQIVIEEYVA
ncbi:MAG: hypothetical protein E7177_00705 [Erysipelotrichaceae bacterium]|nr:hypothetical protein [Erysipelotrichaceae bacterium]